jgi:glycerol-3-phosphate acyltransferase PlsY
MLYSYICESLGVVNTTTGGILMIVSVLLCIASAYLIGSINPAIILSKKLYHEDIRSYGSGNAGATNTLRTYGTKMAILIFVLDLLKSAVAIILGSLILTLSMGGAISALFVVLGHMFPIYYKFKGGKGVACTAVCILMLSPISFVILLALFILIAALTRFVSLGSIMCAMLFPFLAYIFQGDDPGFIPLSALCIGAMVVFMHRENIKRLMAGKESKFSFKKTDKHKAEEHDGTAQTAPKPEKEYSDEDFVKCSCGRIIPKTRETCVYCGEKNPAFVPETEEKGGKKKKK